MRRARALTEGLDSPAASDANALACFQAQVAASTAMSQYKTALNNQLQSAVSYLNQHTAYGNQAACSALNTFKTLATSYSAIPASTGITPAMATAWNAQVDLIKAAIPC